MSDPQDPNDRIDPESVRPLHKPQRSQALAAVTDIRTIRRARARTSCSHHHALFDPRARVLECADCGVSLDPFDSLEQLTRHPEWVLSMVEERGRLGAEIEKLRVEHDALRTKVAAAKRDARKHDTETRLDYLSEALELLRQRARSGRVDATYVAHLTTAVLKGHSITLADQVAGNASRLADQHAKRTKRIS